VLDFAHMDDALLDEPPAEQHFPGPIAIGRVEAAHNAEFSRISGCAERADSVYCTFTLRNAIDRTAFGFEFLGCRRKDQQSHEAV
jgi:hypothetical protein